MDRAIAARGRGRRMAVRTERPSATAYTSTVRGGPQAEHNPWQHGTKAHTRHATQRNAHTRSRVAVNVNGTRERWPAEPGAACRAGPGLYDAACARCSVAEPAGRAPAGRDPWAAA
eukprot:4166753-Prymnesium_polylepis.2